MNFGAGVVSSVIIIVVRIIVRCEREARDEHGDDGERSENEGSISNGMAHGELQTAARRSVVRATLSIVRDRVELYRETGGSLSARLSII